MPVVGIYVSAAKQLNRYRTNLEATCVQFSRTSPIKVINPCSGSLSLPLL